MNSNRTNPKYVLLEMYHFKLISVVIPAHLAGLKRVEGFFGKFQIMETYGAYMLLDLRTTCALRPCSTRANLAHFVHEFSTERVGRWACLHGPHINWILFFGQGQLHIKQFCLVCVIIYATIDFYI